MMKYRNSEYNRKRNELLKNAGLLGLGLAAAAFGHILANTDSLLAAAASLISVLGVLGVSSLRNLKAY